jgi:HSP20 family protein
MSGKREKKVAGNADFGGLLGGLGTFIEKLGELAEKGKELHESGEIHGPGGKMRGVYGFNIKFGLGDEGAKVEPFGNVQRDSQTGEPIVTEVREPMVDVFYEKEQVVVVAEMPGVGEGDVKLELRDDVLVILAEGGDKKYRKEVLLPGSFAPDKMKHTCHNGVLEVKLDKCL